MTSNLISIKSFLGKYYNDLLHSCNQEKYRKTSLHTLLEQRFQIQDNKTQVVVDPLLDGYQVIVSGNQFVVSKTFFDHPSVEIVNTIEQQFPSNPALLFQPEVFSTVAYLLCPNRTMITIVDDLDEPLYIRYTSDFEKFYNSVITVNIHPGIHIEIVEEILTRAFLNTVTNYIVQECSSLRLSTFYETLVSASSVSYRNISLDEGATYQHLLFGQGSAMSIDETRILASEDSKIELYGVINSPTESFHKLLYIEPISKDFFVDVDCRLIIDDYSNVTYFPAIIGEPPDASKASISVTSLLLDDDDIKRQIHNIHRFTKDIMDLAILDRMAGSVRFYKNKSRFQNLHK